jgi:hypothetical protein
MLSAALQQGFGIMIMMAGLIFLFVDMSFINHWLIMPEPKPFMHL